MGLHLVFTILTLLFPLALSRFGPSPIQKWCSQTPYPETCQYYMDQKDSQNFFLTKKCEFKKIMIKFSLSQARQAQTHIVQLETMSRNDSEKAAWADCRELFDMTIFRLENFTLDDHGNHTNADKQTWLSAAMTNVETCKSGFHELGLSDNKVNFVSRNFSQLISNSLAINAVDATSVATKEEKQLFKEGLIRDSSGCDLVVAQDGSGDFITLREAIEAASKRNGTERFVIYVKKGTYSENVEIGKKVKNITLVGDGIGKTIVTGNKHAGGSVTTFRSATFGVKGDKFIASGITFRNTAGPEKGQAVALRSGSDFSVFYKCSFEGYQDTLYVHSNRQFYRECDIYGTIDFVFGNAAVVLQNCNIFVRKSQRKMNTITAQKRSRPHENTGIVIHNCKVMAGEELSPGDNLVRTYLGRPWGEYSQTVFLGNFLGNLIDPKGWIKWKDDSALSKLNYAEYNNTGPGSSTANRVKWVGYHDIKSMSEASKYTVGKFLLGDSWLPSTGVPFISGL